MRSLRLRLGTTEILLVRARDIVQVTDPVHANRVAETLLGPSPSPDHQAKSAALVDQLLRGDAVLVRLDDAPRLLDEPTVTPLVIDPDPVIEQPRTTWISLELIHAAGSSTEHVEVEVTTASGRELYGRLDAAGRWRCDDIDAGTATVRLLDHPVLQRNTPARRPSVRPSPEDIAWRAGSDPRLQLRAAEHHRIIIVQPPEPYCAST